MRYAVAGPRLNLSFKGFAMFSIGRELPAKRLCPALLVALAMPVGAAGATDDAPGTDARALDLNQVVVTGSRVGHSSFNLPISINVVSSEQMQSGQFMVNASESLARVPGIVAPNTNRFSSDQLISSRGFGARSGFGIRGIRLYADGVPQTMPDGQGQLSTFSLSSAERMEVMRGPFSALYGNSSGGVIQIFTRDGSGAPRATTSAYGGSFGTWRADLQAQGASGALGYLIDASRYESDGLRDHSAVRRDQLNSKLTWQLGEQTKATLVLNSLDQPYNQDPQGLTRAQLQADRGQIQSDALKYNTGGNKSQSQVGANLEHQLTDEDSLQAIVWTGARQTMTRGSTAFNTAVVVKGSGGIGYIDRDFSGTDMRWSHRAATPTGPLTLTLGLTYEHMKDVRTGYENKFGVQDVLRRDEDNIATNSGQYLQAEWELGTHWTLSGGVRRSLVNYENRDRYIASSGATTNPDDSGLASYANNSPVLGLVYHLNPALNLYANAGKGFDTPAFIELAYKPNGASGLNFALQPSTSVHYEAGMKASVGTGMRLNLALFQVTTDKEIVVDTSVAGRTVYANAGKTGRSGLELSIDADLGSNLKASLAYSLLNARFEEAYRSSSTTISSGNRIPGTPRQTLYGELAWKHPASGLTTAIEARYNASIYVDDQNSDAASPYTVVNWHAGFAQRMGGVRLSEFLRIENLGDKNYVGAVLVNNASPFTPAPGRNYLVGVSVGVDF